MANTIMTAKNSFAEGLIMDFAPDNTQATCLTSALNATLLTFNGNEMSLQNDMGNGRVETARLPEGYIPVGTCEFGDIIYIVSYNPLTDKSQIGCFPSPERNISSEEMSDMFQTLTNEEFQGDNGELKRTSVKKVLIDKKLNPGDKYIIYTDSKDITNSPITKNKDKLSDYGQKKHNIDPRIIKLHVVSIEDSGKITYLDSTTKWYDDYYVNSQKNQNDTNKPDIDSYRNLLDSGWSIFSSKVSGKLAILAELETIDSFSCSYTVDLIDADWDGDIKYKKYSLSLTPSYEAKKGVSLAYICATKAYFNNNSKNPTEINYYCATTNRMITDNGTDEIASNSEGWKVIGNNISIDTEFEFRIPYKERRKTGEGKYEEFPIRSDSFIYNIEITPAMSFGRLDYLKVLLTIDFNKIGTGDIDFDIWKYHNSEDSAMLTFGINTYPKPGYEVKYITMDFYDNQGRVMQYLLDGKTSYNGIFNEYFSLNGKNSNSKMSKYYTEVPKIDDKGNSTQDWRKKPSEWRATIDNNLSERDRPDNLIQHKGAILEEKPESYIDEYLEENKDGKTVYYQNDAGVIYGGALYAVRIQIHQGPQRDFNVLKGETEILEVNKEITEKLETTTYYKWYWTTSMFNEYYYNTNDFNTLKFELVLDSKAIFATNPETYIWKTKEVNNLGEPFGTEDYYKTYSANIQYIGENEESNINMYVQAGLQNDYGCFNLFKDNLKNIAIDVSLSQGKLEYSLKGEQYEFSGHDANITDPWFLYKEDIVKNDGDPGTSKMSYLLSSINTHKRDSENQKILDDFNINFSKSIGKTIKTEEPFIDDEGRKITNKTITFLLDECYYQNIENKKPIPLSMSATILNKAYVQDIYTGNVSVPVYTPIIDNIGDLEILGLWGKTNPTTKQLSLYMSGGICLNAHGDDFNTVNFIFNNGQFVSAETDDWTDDSFTGEGIINTSSNKDFLEREWYPIAGSLPEMFLVYPGGHKDTHCYGVTGASWKSPLDITEWRRKHQEGTAPSASESAAKKSELFNDGEKAFDISETGIFSKMNEYNTIAFLGMKHKEGFTLFNCAFKDMADTTNNILSQIAGKDGKSKEYENFAYQLFLLLTNVYHKNKRIADKQLNLKNYVRNGDSDITFTKNIVTKAYENPEVDPTSNDVLMRGISFNEYVNAVKQWLIKNDSYYSETKFDDFNNSLNIHVRFIDSAINNVLTITIKSKPFSFLSAEVEAYLSRNGVLIPTFNLAANTFYLYENEALEVYQNKPLVFNIEEINKRIKHIYGDDYKLTGIHPPSTKYTTDFQEAYNEFVREIMNIASNLSTEYEDLVRPQYDYSSPEQVAAKKQEVVDLIIQKLPNSVGDYSKRTLLQEVYNKPEKSRDYTYPYDQYGWHGAFENFFSCHWYQDTYNGDKFIISLTLNNPIQEQSTTGAATEYTFNCGLNLNNAFTYDGKLQLKNDRAYNKFGLRDDPTSNDEDITGGFGGFMRDVIIDKEFQVVI